MLDRANSSDIRRKFGRTCGIRPVLKKYSHHSGIAKSQKPWLDECYCPAPASSGCLLKGLEVVGFEPFFSLNKLQIVLRLKFAKYSDVF